MTLALCLKAVNLHKLNFNDDRLAVMVDMNEDGLFQFGHSKEHRSDLLQIKINQMHIP